MYKSVIYVAFALCFMLSVSYAYDCCVPPQWQGQAAGVIGDGHVQYKNVYYDSIGKRVRIDIISESFNQTSYTFFQGNGTGKEWVVDSVQGCYITGPDYWNDQCFGESYGLPYIGKQGNLQHFGNSQNGISVSTDENCLPVLFNYVYSYMQFTYYNTLNYIVSDSVFDIPSDCPSWPSNN
ncbi:hypothetical protein PPL_09557 [Heterostelium album PN500]|uniref:Uncharacterized protein n=1 Tax=Heterostelium pallidum (strain ATCC 26659 / Pp 5 / PN500) TaxID=670386 RepID=D3BNE5_HETP5|nr:hypothetical protein PPL_09557 [Heterostelium album PN500]EFA76805.1 hypothetical protein PPL_09557 [Heterostelium album PN500]|eukprot:XP_020428937.1 hypothetical protein PPL_09557 [Heterostelium album PN500]